MGEKCLFQLIITLAQIGSWFEKALRRRILYKNSISWTFTTSIPTWIFSFTSNFEQTRTAEPYLNINDICKIMANAGGVRLLATSLTETHPERATRTNDAVPGTVRKKPNWLYFWSYRSLRKHITRRGIKIAIFPPSRSLPTSLTTSSARCTMY